MTRRLLLVPVILTAALGASVMPASGAGTTIMVKDNVFSPKTKTVKKGTTVTWKWAGRAPHNVVVTKGPVKFKSTIKTSGTYKKTMTRGGTYRIVCTIHEGMTMTLKVT